MTWVLVSDSMAALEEALGVPNSLCAGMGLTISARKALAVRPLCAHSATGRWGGACASGGVCVPG